MEGITAYFTEMYGPPSEKHGYTIWEDSVGQEYGLIKELLLVEMENKEERSIGLHVLAFQ